MIRPILTVTTEEPMRASVDHSACAGHGLCYAVAPTVFTDDEEGFSHLVGDGLVVPGDVEKARRAALACPERAITLRNT
jgi:ferredoxin